MASTANISGAAAFSPEKDPDSADVDILALTQAVVFDSLTNTVARIRIDFDDDTSLNLQAVQVKLMADIIEFTVNTGTDVFTAVSPHGLSLAEEIRFATDGTLPAPLVADTPYYVESTPSSTTFTVTTVPGGSVLDITTAGSGTNTFQEYGSAVVTYTGSSSATGPRVPVVVRANRDGKPDDFSKIRGFFVMLIPKFRDPTIAGTFTANPTTEDITTNADNYRIVGQRVRFSSTDTLPAGLEPDTDYYIISASTNVFTVSLTPGGSVVDITDTGTGVHSWLISGDASCEAYVTFGPTVSPPVDYVSVPLKLDFIGGSQDPVPFWCGSLPEGAVYDPTTPLSISAGESGNPITNASILINLLGN